MNVTETLNAADDLPFELRRRWLGVSVLGGLMWGAMAGAISGAVIGTSVVPFFGTLLGILPGIFVGFFAGLVLGPVVGLIVKRSPSAHEAVMSSRSLLVRTSSVLIAVAGSVLTVSDFATRRFLFPFGTSTLVAIVVGAVAAFWAAAHLSRQLLTRESRPPIDGLMTETDAFVAKVFGILSLLVIALWAVLAPTLGLLA